MAHLPSKMADWAYSLHVKYFKYFSSIILAPAIKISAINLIGKETVAASSFFNSLNSEGCMVIFEVAMIA